MMKIVSVIGIAGLPACYGGFETLVENLVQNTPQGVFFSVFCSSKMYKKQNIMMSNTQLKYINLSANGISSILYDLIGMLRSLNSDVMLILGVSGCIFLPLIRIIFKGKIITNIDGIEWQRAKWKKCGKYILRFSEKMAVKYSNIVIGDNKGIVEYIHKIYGCDANLIEYGGDHAKPVNDDSLYSEYPFCRNQYSITVCRIEPENNIHVILEAFSKHKSLQLIIVGNWKQNEYGSQLQQKYSRFSNLFLLDQIYDNYKINWLRCNATQYIHGQSAGGTNPSLVEAMNLKLPIFAFDCVYNRNTTENKCLFWSNDKELVNLILNTTNQQKKEIASSMNNIVKQRYTWKIISHKYHKNFI